MKKNIGFTLIELMITVAIVAILAAVALPAYNEHVLKTRRALAASCLFEFAQNMERYFTTNMSYASAPLAANSCANDLSASYTFSFATSQPTASTFTIEARPTGGQANDTKCATLGIDQTGTKSITGTKSVAECWK